MTNKDTFFCRVVDDDKVITFDKVDDVETVCDVKGNFIRLKNVFLFTANSSGEMVIIPFKDTALGSEYVTLNVSQLVEIYLVKEELADRIRASMSGIEIIKK